MNKSRKSKTNAKRAVTRRWARRGGPVKSLRDGLRPLASRIFRNRGLGDGGLVLNWAEVVGREIAGCCAPVKIAYPRGEAGRVAGKAGVLHLMVEAGAATLMQHRQSEILSRVNGYLGFRAVDRVSLAQGLVRSHQYKVHSAATPIRDDVAPESVQFVAKSGQTGHQKLDAALNRMGRGIAAKERQKSK